MLPAALLTIRLVPSAPVGMAALSRGWEWELACCLTYGVACGRGQERVVTHQPLGLVCRTQTLPVYLLLHMHC
jgi:hypothetical protein